MEMLKKTNDAQEKKKVVINFGKVARGGGGIGTVILLGGALATAAFASAFIVRKKGQGSGNDSNRKAHNSPPPVTVNKENEQDEANKRKQFTFLDTCLHVTEHPSGETRKEIEIKGDTQNLVLDEKPRIEINGGPPFAACDSEATQGSDQILLSSIAPKVPENNVISDGSFNNKGEFHISVVEEKILPLVLENVKIESLKKDAIDEITEECDGSEEVNAGGESRGDGEINKVKCVEDIEERSEDVAGIGLKLGEEGICSDQDAIGNNGYMPETFVLENHCKDGQERTLPVFETPVTDHENVNGDKKQGFAFTEVVEIIREDDVIEEDDENDDVIEEDDENQVKHMEEEIMPDQKDNVIEEGEENLVIEGENMPEKCEEENKGQRSEVNNEEKIPCQKIEENACIDNLQFGDYDKDVQILTISTPDEEMIFHKDIEVSKEDAANEKDYICQQKDPKDEGEKITKVEGLSETIDTGITIEKDENNITEDFVVDETVDDEDLSDEVEHNSEGIEDSLMESNVGVVWPDEEIQESFIETQQMKLINQEVEGKIEEDKQVKKGKREGCQAKADKGNSNKVTADSTHITSNVTGNSAKSLFEKYVVDPATMKYYSTNTNTRRLLIATIPVLSSLSCSWFFGLSFDKLCLILALTIVLSKSMIVE